jgi:hypothetical protein
MTSIIKVDQIQNAAGTAGLSIDSSGRVLTPVRPAFFAYLIGNQGTGAAATDEKVGFNALDFNHGNVFSTTNSEFTVPVSGLYQINACVTWLSNSQSARYVRASIFKNNSDFQIEGHAHASNETSDSDYHMVSFGAVMDLESGDVLKITAATSNASISVAGFNKTTHFSGYLIG